MRDPDVRDRRDDRPASTVVSSTKPVDRDVSVLLLAHGSERSSASAEPVLTLARRLRSAGYEDVQAAFWKEEPFLHQAVASTLFGRVVAVPIFLAEGYFTRTVVPRETGLECGMNDVAGRAVRLLRPVGTSPALDDLVVERARAALPPEADPERATVVVLGHGTPRSPDSGRTVFDACARLSMRGLYAEVVPAFIDQEPRIEREVKRLRSTGRSGPVVVVPFLVSAGWHGGTTVPAQLGDRSGDGPVLYYTDPIGTHPFLAELVRTMVAEAVSEGVFPPPLDGSGVRAATVPTELFEVRVARVESGYEIRHVRDRSAPADELRVVSPDEAERLARRDAFGGHRPLRSAAGLAGGWRVSTSDASEARRVVRALYGSALADRHAWRHGDAKVHDFSTTAARQSGAYAAAGRADAEDVRQGVERCCVGRRCLRIRVWDPGAVGTADAGDVPCLRPCPLLLSTVAAEVDRE